LGRGRYGNVYVAKHIKDGLIVALKVMNKVNLYTDGFEAQIRREIEIHSRLDHPNVLKMYGYFWDDINIYFILEFACGQSLFD
jgi:serine/threonine protein kinase